ncbi:unnamed protein product [Paramecium pentaurelia]|uniref:Uncharacterized protein n=1 Tax=Paramecium pentaurelia TaxID=43138 RepID=A0A8S1XW17_9CILI|nr:unnamed protein product [Paramecium pentaurelia]
MNQPQRSLSNLGMSKSHYIPEQNRTSSAFYKRDEQSRLDQQLARYEEFKRNYKRNELKYSYYQQYPRDMNQSLVEERYQNSYNYRPNQNTKHLQTQQYEYDRDIYKKENKYDSPIRVELSYTAPSSAKKGVISDTAAYLREREKIMNSFMTQEEIQRIKRIYYRK